MANWFRSMARRLVSGKRPTAPHRARRAHVALEILEDRVTPSTAPLAVTSYYDSAIYEFNATTGALMSTLVAPNSQTTLQNPAGITVGPDGNLYISSQGNDSIVEYNLTTHSLSTFISASVLGPIATSNGDSAFGPAGMAFGPDGNLYVALSAAPGAAIPTGPGGVVRFDLTNNGGLAYSGQSAIIASAPTLNAPGGLVDPTEMAFGVGAANIDTLYVSDSGVGSVVAIPHAVAQTPGALTTFVAPGSGPTAHPLIYPTGLAWSSSGALEVVDLGNPEAQTPAQDVGQVLTFKMPTAPASTTLTAGSNDQQLPLTNGTIDVKSTAGFPASGGLFINGINTTVTYTGKTATSFTGVTGGSPGTELATGMTATSTDALAPYVSSFAQPLSRLTGAFPSDAVFNSSGQLLTADLGPTDSPGAGTIDEFGSGGAFLKSLVTATTVGANAQSDFTPSQLTLNLGNMAPSVSIAANYSVNEGSSVTLHAIGTDAQGFPLTYTWDINGDGIYGDATGANPTLTWAQLVALGVDSSGTFNVRVIASDGHGQVTTSQPATLTVNYTPVMGPSMVVTSFFDGALYEYGANGGTLKNTLAAPYSNQGAILTNPAGVTDGPDGNLYISNQNAFPPAGAAPTGESIVRENLSTNTLSTFIDNTVLENVVATLNDGDPQFDPAGITFGPDGNLYVALNGGYSGNPDAGAFGANPGAIVRFNITTVNGVLTYAGSYQIIATNDTGLATLGQTGLNANSLFEPSGITFGIGASDMDNLYIANSGGGAAAGSIVKITDATGANPTASVFVQAGAEGLAFPEGVLFQKNGDLIVTDFGSGHGAVTSPGRIERYGPNGQTLTPIVTGLVGQFPTETALTSSGNLIVVEEGSNYPPNLLGSIREFSGSGASMGTLESSSQFAVTGPGDSGSPSDSGFSPGALVLNAGTRAPVVNPGTGYTIAEGHSVTLNVQAQDPNGAALTYSWDVNGDGAFGDATGKSPTLSWAQLVKHGIDQAGTWQVQVMVADADGHVVTSSTVPLTVTYTPPTLRISGLATIKVGQTYTLQLASLPTGADYNFISWTINWGDGSLPQTVEGDTPSVTHVFTKAAHVTITATATNNVNTYDSNDLLLDVVA